MFRRGNPFVRAREETPSTHRASHLRAGLSLSWPSHVHIQPNLLKSCHYARDDAVAILKSDAYVVTQRGRKRHRRTTVGWKLLVKWSDGSETWVPLKDMKEWLISRRPVA